MLRRAGRLDLKDQVDGAHVDAELQRAGRDEARQAALLQQLLDDRPLLARERSVVGAGDLLLCELVQAQRDPLGRAAVVDEDDRRAVLADQCEELGVDRRPDRRARALAAGEGLERIGRRVDRLRRFGHRLDRHLDPYVELLAHTGVEDPHLPGGPDQVAADLLQRALGRAQADPLDLPAACAAGELLQALERQGQVRAALGLGHRVDLVDDDRLDAPEHLPARAR